MSRVFVLHGAPDVALAKGLAGALRADHDVFLAVDDVPPGSAWPDEIAAALDAAEVVVAVLSEASVDRWHVRDELVAAIERARTGAVRIVPIRLRDAGGALCPLPYGLRATQALDAGPFPSGATLADAVRASLERRPQRTVAPSPPPWPTWPAFLVAAFSGGGLVASVAAAQVSAPLDLGPGWHAATVALAPTVGSVLSAPPEGTPTLAVDGARCVDTPPPPRGTTQPDGRAAQTLQLDAAAAEAAARRCGGQVARTPHAAVVDAVLVSEAGDILAWHARSLEVGKVIFK